MRRFFIILLATGLSFAGKGLAAEPTRGPEAIEFFYHTFKYAKNVSWTEYKGMLRISFTEDDHQQFAYYNDAKELVAVTTKIAITELPAPLQKELETDYKGYKIIDTYLLTDDTKSEYYVLVEREGKQKLLQGRKKKWHEVKGI